MEEKLFEKAFEIDPMWGLVVGMLLFGSVAGATFLGILLRVLWRENRAQDDRERSSLERTLILLDRVGDGLKAAERDRELRAADKTERVLFESEMRQAFKGFDELRSALVQLIRDNHNDLIRAVEQRSK